MDDIADWEVQSRSLQFKEAKSCRKTIVSMTLDKNKRFETER